MFCNILISIRIFYEITGLELYIGVGCLFIGYMTGENDYNSFRIYQHLRVHLGGVRILFPVLIL